MTTATTGAMKPRQERETRRAPGGARACWEVMCTDPSPLAGATDNRLGMTTYELEHVNQAPREDSVTAPTVVLIGTLDTKGAEYTFLRERLEAAGVGVLVVDVGTLGPPGGAA